MPRLHKLLFFLLLFSTSFALVGCGVTGNSSSGGSADFGVSLDSTSYTVAAGSTTTASITASGTNGFSSAISVAVTGLPSGVTVSPASFTINPGATQKVTVTASSSAAPGTTTVSITGTSGTLTHTVTLQLTVTASQPAPDFALSVSPSALSLAAGASSKVTLSATAQGGFASAVSIAIAGLPAGVTASPSTLSLQPGTPQQVTLTAGASAAAATATVTFTGTSGSLSHQASLALTVTASSGGGSSQPDFSLTLSPPSLSVTAGSSSQTSLAVTPSGGFAGNVNVTVSGLPTGVTVTPQSIQVAANGTQTFQFSASSTAPAGKATVSITGASGSITHSVTLTLTVTAGSAAPDFAMSLNPSSASLAAGASLQIALTATSINGFNGQVNTAVTGLPAGSSVSPSAPVLTPGLPQFVTISIPATTPSGPVAVTFTGKSGTLTHTVTLALNVTAPAPPADFSLAISPNSDSLQQGGTQTVTLSATAIGGYNGTIAVAVSGLPTGVTTSPASFTLTPGIPQSVTLTAAANATIGSGVVTFTGTSGSLTHSVNLALNVTAGQPAGNFTLSVTPGSTGLNPGQTSAGPVSVLATAQNGFTATVSVSLSGLPSGVTASPASLTLTPGQAQTITFSATSTAVVGTYTVTLTGTSGSLTETATLTFNIVAPMSPSYDVTTYHYDALRSGLNPNETTLTTANVNQATFGKVGFDTVDGKVDAQPLYVSAVLVNGAYHNVLYIATEHDSVFAFDADNGTQLWQVSALPSGETPSDDHGCNQITPEIGITSTPVVDRKQGANGTIFVVAMSKDANGAYHQRLHALDLTTGAELQGGPTEIQATYPGNGATSQNGTNTFDPGQYAERASLLLVNGTIYMGWTSHCDQTPYSGWIMAYSESTLQQTSVLNLTPNGSEGSVWMSGGGLAADANGNVYVLTANGTFDTTLNSSKFPVNSDFGNAFVKMSTANGTLSVADYYEPNNGPQESASDTDLGSGGVLLLPDIPAGPNITLHLAVGAGKDGNLYVVSRDAMGEYMNTSTPPPFPMVLTGTFPNGVYGSPAYFNNVLYYGGVGDNLKAFPVFSLSPSSGPSSKSATTFAYPGATPSISANGTSGGIVWALESATTAPGVLHAYDATNLGTELYNSTQASNGRDSFGNGNKFITPVVVNGKVYVGTQNGVAVFGLLN